MKKKKIVGIVFILLILIFMGVTLFIVPNISAINNDRIILGAHRGNSVDYIENTIPAFESAVEDDKYSFIEFDVQSTNDNVVIAFHDKSLLRMQQNPQSIKDLTYEELLNISEYHIPTYEEVMNIVYGKKPLNIEIKSRGEIQKDIFVADYIINDLKNKEILENTLISSISNEVLVYIKEKYPDVKTGKVYWIAESTFIRNDLFTEKIYEEINEVDADYIMLHGSNIRNYDSLKRLLPKDKTLVIWFFSDEMYIIDPEPSSWVFKTPLKYSVAKAGEEKDCIWWC